MKSAIFDLIRSMDRNNVELQLVLQCAPVIAGIKISNLLIIPTETLFPMLHILKSSHFRYFLLRKDDQKTAILLYHPEKLQEYLKKKENAALLRKLGYEQENLGQILVAFRERYQSYMESPVEFPHEMGVLLGYPIEDVVGFMENEGKDFLYTGYWKVYENLAEKIQLFRHYEQVKEQQVQMIADGIHMNEIMRLYEFAA